MSCGDPRHDRLNRILIVLCALLPPIGVYAPLGAAPFLTVVALMVVILEPRRYWSLLQERRWLVLAFATVSLWGMASSLWSILPAHSAFEGGRLFAISMSGLAALAGLGVLVDVERLTICRVVAMSVIFTVAVFLIDEVAFNHPLLRYVIGAAPDMAIRLERFDRGTTVLGLLFWPLSLALWTSRRYALLIGLVIATAAALILIPSSTNRLAVLIGLVVWLIALWLPRITAGVMAIGAMLLILLMPYAIPRLLPANEAIITLHHQAPWIKFSALHRMLIWRFTSERIAERPWLGWGMDASRELPGGHSKLAETISEPALLPPDTVALPLHPHNAVMQWCVELGFPAALFCALVVASLLWRCGRFGPIPVRAASLACAASAITIALLGYGIWQAWWMSTLWLAAALLARPFPTRV